MDNMPTASKKEDDESKSLVDIKLDSVIYRGSSSELMYGKLATDQDVLVKRIALGNQTPENLDAIKNEFEILKILDGCGSPKPIGFVEIEGLSSIVLKTTASIPLRCFLSNNNDIRELILFAYQWSLAICELHKKGIVHRELNPSHIFVHKEKSAVEIIDFSHARIMNKTQSTLPREDKVDVHLSYIAPELTWRTQKFYDERVDLYSFGVSLYELFTGSLPFDATDPIELIHAHLAKEPAYPTDVNSSIPEALADLILRLMEKSPEKRYLGAIGVAHDLKIIYENFENANSKNIKIAQFDRSLRLVIPQKSYGRYQEITALEKQWQFTSSGCTRFVLVKGSSGSGKTTLIQEVGSNLWNRHAFVGSGKFEILARDVPFEVICNCIRQLIAKIHTEPESIYNTWKRRVIQNIGKNTALLIDYIPELSEFLHRSDQPFDLPPQESKDRLLNSFNDLLRSFTNLGRPVVIFLDDLQWADATSLELLSTFARDDQEQILIIGSCREEDLEFNPLLLSQIHFWKTTLQNFTEISVGPIDEDAINLWCCDALHLNNEQCKAIANVLYQRSSGNPFYIRQILLSLYKDDFITFSIAESSWKVDVSGIHQAPIGEKVLSLILSRLKSLNKNLQNILATASFVGLNFDCEFLSKILRKSVDEIKSCLIEAESENLIVSTDIDFGSNSQNRCYRFLHDKIIEAAQTLFDSKSKKQICFAIANQIIGGRQDFSGLSTNDWPIILQAIQYYILSSDLIEDGNKRTQIATLTCLAGEKAQASAAWTIASDLFYGGNQILGDHIDQTNRLLSRRIRSGYGSCLILSNRISEAKNLFESLLIDAVNDIEMAEVYALLGVLYESIGDHRSALDSCLSGLRVLKEWTGTPNIGVLRGAWSAYQCQKKLVRFGRDSILKLPKVNGEKHLLTMRLITQAAHPALLINPYLAICLACKQIDLVLSHGHSKYSILAFLSLAMSINGASAVSGLRLWTARSPELLLDLYQFLEVSQPKDRNRLERELAYHGFTSHWSMDIRHSQPEMMRLVPQFMDLGDKNLAAASILFSIDQAIMMGFNLINLRSAIAGWRQYVNKNADDRDKLVINQLYSFLDEMIDGSSESITHWIGLHESEFPADVSQITRYVGSQVRRGAFYALFHCYSDSYRDCIRSWFNGLPKRQAGNYKMIVMLFYLCLSIAETYESSSRLQKIWRLLVLYASRRVLNVYSDMRQNFSLPKKIFADAIWILLRKRDLGKAQHLIENAIDLAKSSQLSVDHGVMAEFLGRRLIKDNKPRMALGLLLSARDAYERCGFLAKVREINLNILNIESSNLLPRSESEKANLDLLPRSVDTSALLDIPTMTKATYTLSQEIKLDHLKTKLLRLLFENAGARYAALLWRNKEGDNSRGRMRIVAYRDADGFYSNEEIEPDDTIVSLCAIGYVTRSKSSLIVDSVADNPMWNTDTSLTNRGAKSLLCVPIIVGGEQNGVIYLENNLLECAFSVDRVSVISILAGQIAISLDNASLYEQLSTTLAAERKARDDERRAHEAYVVADTARIKLQAGLEAAEVVQKSLVDVQQFEQSYDIAYLFEPAENTGGDWLTTMYDEDRHWLYLCLGDVTGHGVPAALVTAAAAGAAASTIARFNNMKIEMAQAVEEMLSAMNSAVVATRGASLQLMTMVVVAIDLSNGSSYYANAGHHPILWLGKQSSVILESADPLGYSDTPRFGCRSLQLEPGDRLLLYSDGLLENYDSGGKRIRLSSLKSLATEQVDPQMLIAALAERVENFISDTAKDDTACLAFRWTRSAASLRAG